MTSENDRLTELEIQIMQQNSVIDDLNEVVTRQAKEIDDLNRKMMALVNRVMDIEDGSADPHTITKPPHY